MKFIYFLTATLLFVTSTELFSQTKFIAHRSHSGSGETFRLAHPGNLGTDYGKEYYRIDTTSGSDTTGIGYPHFDALNPFTLQGLEIFRLRMLGGDSIKLQMRTVDSVGVRSQALDSVRVKVLVVDTMKVITPETPDSVKLQVPPVGSLNPSIPNEKLREGTLPVSYNNSSSAPKEGNRNGLIWLALGLGLPAIVIARSNLRRGRESDHV